MGVKTQVGRVTGSEIRKNKDGTKNVVMLQVELTDPDDIQSIEFINQAGEDSRPVVGSKVIIQAVSPAYKVAVASDDGIVPTTAAGEKEIYSSSGGSRLARIKLKSDGLVAIVSPDESMATLVSDLIDAIVGIVTTGSPTTHTVNAASQTALNDIKTRFSTLLGGI